MAAVNLTDLPDDFAFRAAGLRLVLTGVLMGYRSEVEIGQDGATLKRFHGRRAYRDGMDEPLKNNGAEPSGVDSTGGQTAKAFRAVLHAHRSLSQNGFLILMLFIGGISFVTGVAFILMGAWPVFGFFGLDVLAIYVAFKINYRDGLAHEVVELTPDLLKLTRVSPTGTKRSFDFNPYWVRVRLAELPDGRTNLSLALHGRDFEFGQLLNHDERREFARVLERALSAARGSMNAQTQTAT
jgi:uncharacterized membrane protein